MSAGSNDPGGHSVLGELTNERREGYAWYGSGPRATVERAHVWREGK